MARENGKGKDVTARVDSLLAQYDQTDDLATLEGRLKKLNRKVVGLVAAALASVLLGLLASKLMFLVLLFLAQFFFPILEKRKELASEIDELRDALWKGSDEARPSGGNL